MLNNKEKMKAEKLKFTIIQNKNKFKKNFKSQYHSFTEWQIKNLNRGASDSQVLSMKLL